MNKYVWSTGSEVPNHSKRFQGASSMTTYHKPCPQEYYVYAYLRNKTSLTAEENSPYYIGKGKNNRAFASHGNVPVPKDKSKIVIIESNLTENDALSIETELIAKYGRKDIGTGILLNRTGGGDGVSGYNHTESHKTYMSEKLSGKHIPIEQRSNLEGFICRYGEIEGTEKYLETNKKKDTSSLKYYIKKYGPIEGPIKFNEYRLESSKRMLGNNNPFYGKIHTAETRDRISSSRTGKKIKRTAEHNAKIGLANKGREMPKIDCEYCDKSISIVNYRRWHGKNCKKYSHQREKLKCEYCNVEVEKSNFNRHHGRNCRVKLSRCN